MLLGSRKTDIDALFGRPRMFSGFFGLQNEKTYTYPWGDFEVIVGFLNDLARYAAVRRRNGPNTIFSPAELAGALSLNAPASRWLIETREEPPKKAPTTKNRPPVSSKHKPATYLSFVEEDPKQKGKVLCELHGWMPGGESYVFFYQPEVADQPPLLVSEWGVQKALG